MTSAQHKLIPMVHCTLTNRATKESYPIELNRFSIGRSSDCHLQLDQPNISRDHCEIIFSKNRLFIVDRKSKVGVVLNGKKIDQVHRLKHNDIIHIGDFEFEVSTPEEALTQRQSSAEEDPPENKTVVLTAVSVEQPAKSSATSSTTEEDLFLKDKKGKTTRLRALNGHKGITLGRAQPSDILWDKPSISGKHAAFSFQRGKWYITDLQSTNGVKVNGLTCKPGKWRKVAPGDSLMIGEEQFKLFAIDSGQKISRKVWLFSLLGCLVVINLLVLAWVIFIR